LASIKEGFKPAILRNGGKKEAEQGGSTIASRDANKSNMLLQALVGLVKEIICKKEPSVKFYTRAELDARCDLILTNTSIAKKPEPVELMGEDEDNQWVIDPWNKNWRESILEEVNKVWHFQVPSRQIPPRRGGSGGMKSAQSDNEEMIPKAKYRERIEHLIKSKRIHEEEYGKPMEEALGVIEEARQKREMMVTSQHVYVFRNRGQADWENVYTSYVAPKKEPVVIRMKAENFKLLTQDAQAQEGLRSREGVDGERIEIYQQATNNLRSEWSAGGWSESGRWKRLLDQE
jgi:hypothetical protein